MTIAPVVVGVIWRLMYASDIGIVNPLFQAVRARRSNVLAHPTSAFIGVVVVDVWEWTPLMFLIILAGLQSIPQEPIEAARVDGAEPLQRVLRPHAAAAAPGADGRRRAAARSTRSAPSTRSSC